MVRKHRSKQRRSASPATRNGSSIVDWVIVVAILVFLVAFLLQVLRGFRETVWRSQCQNNLKQIAVALYSYKADFGVFPPACTVGAEGEPLHSWRTLILPYLGQETLYRRIDLAKPWDHEVNATARNSYVSTYRCLSREVEGQSTTTYLAVVTPDSCMGSTGGCSLADAAGGQGETLLIVEVGPHHAVPWMAPVDTDESLLEKLRPEDAQPHRGGFHVVYVGGNVGTLSVETTEDEWLRLTCATKNKH